MRAIWAVCSLTQVLVYMNKALSGHLREFKNKGQVHLGNPKSGRGRLREPFITKFKSQTAQTGFHKGGRNHSRVAYGIGRKKSFDCREGGSTNDEAEIRVSFSNIFIKKALRYYENAIVICNFIHYSPSIEVR